MNKATIFDVDFKGKRALVRVDFNVPQLDDGTITDTTRIQAALPTINYLLENGAKVILMSHLGRPKGKFDMKYTLKPVAEKLSELIGKPVTLAADVIGDSAKACVDAMKEGDIVEVVSDASTETILYAEMPVKTQLKITYTEPGLKGDTATNTTKPATVETGAEVRVPLFINEGEIIEVDTRDGSYVNRVKA